MCFSAGASFSSSIVLSGIGIATVKSCQQPNQKMFAMIPFIFGLLQLAEGFIWVSLNAGNQDTRYYLGLFLFCLISQVIWPVWVPLSMLKMETDLSRRKLLKWFLPVAFGVSLYLGCCLIIFPIGASISSHHIVYQMDFPENLYLIFAVSYLIVTIIPTLLSTVENVRWLGVAILMAFLVAAWIYCSFLSSIWCFFSSLLSAFVYFIVKKNNKSVNTN